MTLNSLTLKRRLLSPNFGLAGLGQRVEFLADARSAVIVPAQIFEALTEIIDPVVSLEQQIRGCLTQQHRNIENN